MKTIVWMGAALMSGLFYSLTNIISTKVNVQEGFKAQFYQVPGLLAACLVYFFYRIYWSLKNGQKWNSWFIETFYLKDEVKASKDKTANVVYDRPNWPVVGVVTVCGLSDCCDNFIFILVCDYTFKAGINFSVIMSLFTCLPLVISFTFWIVFKEKLTKLQLFAIIFAVINVSLISFSKDDILLKEESVEVRNKLMHPIWAVLMLLSVLFFITFRLTLVRKYWNVKGKELDSMVLSFTWSFVVNTCLLIYGAVHFTDLIKNNESFERDITYSFLGGLFGNAADGLEAWASTVGVGGVATLLAGTSSFIQTFIEKFMFGIVHSTFDYVIQGIGFVIVVLCIY